jgi:hypothetical protein
LNTDKLEAATTATLTNKTINLTSNTLVATSAQILAAITDETGTGSLVFGTNPTLTGATLAGTVSGGGNQINNVIIGTTTPLAGAFTTLSATGALTFTSTGTGSAANNWVGSDGVGGVYLHAPNTKLASISVGSVDIGVFSGSGLAVTGTISATTPIATTSGGTGLSSFTSGGVVYASSSSALATGSALYFDGTKLGINTSSPVRTLSIANGGPVVEIDPAGGTAGPIYFNYNRSTATYLTPEYWALAHIWNVSGGTEAMRLTSTSLYTASGINVGFGTSNPTRRLVTKFDSASTYSTSDFDSTSNNLYLQNADTTINAFTGIQFLVGGNGEAAISVIRSSDGAADIAFGTRYAGSRSQKMLLTAAGNVGIGTSSPAYKLDVTGTMRSSAAGVWNSSFTSTTGGLIYCDNSAGGGAVLNIRKGRDIGTGSVDGVGLDALNTALNTVVPMILRGSPLYINDGTGTTTFSAGNLGLGVTPSAWYSTAKVYQFSTSGALWALNTQQNTLLSTNEYLDTSAVSRYLATGFGMRYQQTDGQHRWLNAPSGTAGNAITFTQALTLDASGNLGLAETNPSAYGGFVTKYAGIGLHANSTSGASGLNLYEGGTGRFSLRTLNGSAGLSFYDSFNGAERARIESSGRVCIGGPVVTDTHLLNIQGSTATHNIGIVLNKTNATAQIWGITNTGPLAFYNYTGSSEAARFDTSGNLGVGTTSPQSKLDVETSASGALGAVISVGNLAATATSNECSFGFKASSAFTSGYYSARISSLMNSATVTDNAMLFYTYGSGSAAGGTERARITSGGNFLINSPNQPSGTSPDRLLQITSGTPAVGAANSNGVITFMRTIADNTATTILTVADIDKWAGVILLSYVRDADQNRSGMLMVRYKYSRGFTILLSDSQNSGATFSVSGSSIQVTIGGAGNYLCQFTIWGGAGA